MEAQRKAASQIRLFILATLVIKVARGSMLDRTYQNITDITTETIIAGITYANYGHNLLKHIPAGHFGSLPDLNTLLFEYNEISTVDDFALSNLYALNVLYLRFNKLKVITTNMLKGLSGLTQLLLNNNLIHTVQILAFSDLTSLTTCLLYSNQLKSLPESAFDPNNLPTALGNINIRSNDLLCDCEMVWLKESDGTWITVGFADNTACIGPTALAGRKWDTLTVQEMETLGKGSHHNFTMFFSTLTFKDGIMGVRSDLR